MIGDLLLVAWPYETSIVASTRWATYVFLDRAIHIQWLNNELHPLGLKSNHCMLHVRMTAPACLIIFKGVRWPDSHDVLNFVCQRYLLEVGIQVSFFTIF